MNGAYWFQCATLQFKGQLEMSLLINRTRVCYFGPGFYATVGYPKTLPFLQGNAWCGA